MGEYGVIPIASLCPDYFKGLLVASGDHDLGNKWMSGEFADYMDLKKTAKPPKKSYVEFSHHYVDVGISSP